MFGPLSFPSSRTDFKCIPFENTTTISDCLLCERQFNVSLQENEFLQHLFDAHKLVLGDVPLIANLDK